MNHNSSGWFLIIGSAVSQINRASPRSDGASPNMKSVNAPLCLSGVSSLLKAPEYPETGRHSRDSTRLPSYPMTSTGIGKRGGRKDSGRAHSATPWRNVILVIGTPSMRILAFRPMSFSHGEPFEQPLSQSSCPAVNVFASWPFAATELVMDNERKTPWRFRKAFGMPPMHVGMVGVNILVS